MLLDVNPKFTEEAKKVFAFSCGGKKFYCFADNGYAIYYKRFSVMQQKIQQKEEWRVTADVLDGFIATTESISNDGTKSPEQRLSDMNVLLQNLKWRRQQHDEMAFLYDLASIWFFGEDEDPAEFTQEIARKNISIWTADPSTFAFFLRCPLKQFIPELDFSQPSILNYLKNLNQTTLIQSIHQYSLLSKEEKESGTGQHLKWLVEHYKSLLDLTDFDYSTTTTS